jgi:hypothetical protein
MFLTRSFELNLKSQQLILPFPLIYIYRSAKDSFGMAGLSRTKGGVAKPSNRLIMRNVQNDTVSSARLSYTESGDSQHGYRTKLGSSAEFVSKGS